VDMVVVSKEGRGGVVVVGLIEGLSDRTCQLGSKNGMKPEFWSVISHLTVFV
jgi:hypothetical protein